MGDRPVRKWLGSGDRRSARWDGEAGLTSGSERERDREGMVFIQQQQRRSLQVSWMKKEGPLQRKKLDGGAHTEVHPEGRMKDMLMCFNFGDGRWLGVLQPHGHPFCHWRCRMALTACR